MPVRSTSAFWFRLQLFCLCFWSFILSECVLDDLFSGHLCVLIFVFCRYRLEDNFLASACK